MITDVLEPDLKTKKKTYSQEAWFTGTMKYCDETPINYCVGKTPKMDSLKTIFHKFQTVLFPSLPPDSHKIKLLRNLR